MEDIKSKTKLGIVWNILEKTSVQVIGFVLNIIMARLLTPNDYGTVGMLAIFLSFSNVFIDSGFSRALIQKQDRSEKDFSTTLIFNVVVSVFLYIILYFASPSIARFYKAPELVSLQRIFFVLIILNSLTVVQVAQLEIKIDFKRIAIVNTVAMIISGLIGIICAYKGLGPWALVVQALVKSFITVLLFWILGKWIPKTGFSMKSFKQLFGFGSKLLISGLLGTAQNNIRNLVIGKYYNTESLGYYTRGQQFPELLAGTLGTVMNNSTFPLLASLQNSKDELVATLKKLVQITSMVVFPCMIGMAVISHPLIFVVLGEKWLPTAELLFWLSLSYIFTPLSIINMNVLNAIGRSDLFLKVDLAKIPLDILVMVVTFSISIRAVVIGRAVTALIYFIINCFMTGKLYKFGAVKQLACAWKYILSSVIMGIVVFTLTKIIKNSVVSLFAGICAGVVIYIVLLFLLKDCLFLNTINGIKFKIFKNEGKND